MKKKSIVHMTLGFNLRGGVQCWLNLAAKHTADRFTHYILTPNVSPETLETACIVPKFSHAGDEEPDLRRHLVAGELPEVGHRSRFITDEILSYISNQLKPEIIVIYGNDAQELFIPARLMHSESLIVLRAQYHQGLPLEWLQKYIDAIIMFHDNPALAGLGKPIIELHRTYDDTVFQRVTPFHERCSDAVAYFGRFNELKGVDAFDVILPILREHSKSLHLYTTPTPPSAGAGIEALIKRYPDNVVCYPWITDPAALAQANNRYRVVISPGASNNLANTFGQSNLEAVACGAKLIVLLDENNRARYSHTKGKYLDYENVLFKAVSRPEEMAWAAIEALDAKGGNAVVEAADLREFGITHQRERMVSFLVDQYARKFGEDPAQC